MAVSTHVRLGHFDRLHVNNMTHVRLGHFDRLHVNNMTWVTQAHHPPAGLRLEDGWRSTEALASVRVSQGQNLDERSILCGRG